MAGAGAGAAEMKEVNLPPTDLWTVPSDVICKAGSRFSVESDNTLQVSQLYAHGAGHRVTRGTHG